MLNVFGRRSHDQEPSDEATPVTPRAFVNPIAEIEVVGETVVATLTVTELCQDVGSGRLAELLYDLGQSGAKHFVLDIQNVQHIDSACLGCLVEALNLMATRDSDGKIALANVDNAVKSLFRITKLDRLFPVCPDIMSALEAVEGKPEE